MRLGSRLSTNHSRSLDLAWRRSASCICIFDFFSSFQPVNYHEQTCKHLVFACGFRNTSWSFAHHVCWAGPLADHHRLLSSGTYSLLGTKSWHGWVCRKRDLYDAITTLALGHSILLPSAAGLDFPVTTCNRIPGAWIVRILDEDPPETAELIRDLEPVCTEYIGRYRVVHKLPGT